MYDQLNSNIQLKSIIDEFNLDTKGNDNSIISIKEDFFNGKCFSLKAPTLDGIKALYFKTPMDHDMYLVFHSPQLYFSSNEYQDKIIKRNTTVFIKIDYNVRKVLDYEGKPCTDYGNSTRDECFLKAIDQVLMKEVGCTTPFSYDKSNICTQPTYAAKAQGIYDQYLYQNSLLESTCPRSCTHLKSQITSDTTYPGQGLSRINFPDYIQVFESYYTYDGLSMVAEIGGYVGLFLGVSVNQVGVLFNKLFYRYQ